MSYSVRNELIRRNQKVRRAIEALPRRVFERQPFVDKADAEKKISELVIASCNLSRSRCVRFSLTEL